MLEARVHRPGDRGQDRGAERGRLLLPLVCPRLLKLEELHPVVVLLPGQLLEAGAHCPGGRGQDRRAERGRRPLPLLRDRVESASRS